MWSAIVPWMPWQSPAMKSSGFRGARLIRVLISSVAGARRLCLQDY